MQEAIITGLAILLSAAIAMLLVSPEAKRWAAEIIERLGHFLCTELRVRAEAQTAARRAWHLVYQGAWDRTAAASLTTADVSAAAESIQIAARVREMFDKVVAECK